MDSVLSKVVQCIKALSWIVAFISIKQFLLLITEDWKSFLSIKGKHDSTFLVFHEMLGLRFSLVNR